MRGVEGWGAIYATALLKYFLWNGTPEGLGLTAVLERRPLHDRSVYQPCVQMEGAGTLGCPRLCGGPWRQAGGGAVRPGPQDRSAVARPGVGSGRAGARPSLPHAAP